MKISNEPLVPGSPVQFILTGFPIDEAIATSIQRFYQQAGPQADRHFQVYNTFKEQIFGGMVDESGVVQSFEVSDRHKKLEPKPE